MNEFCMQFGFNLFQLVFKNYQFTTCILEQTIQTLYLKTLYIQFNVNSIISSNLNVT